MRSGVKGVFGVSRCFANGEKCQNLQKSPLERGIRGVNRGVNDLFFPLENVWIAENR